MLAFGYIALNCTFAIVLDFWLDLNPALVGMSIAITVELAGAFQYMVRQMIEIENAMTSVQRIREYTSLESEADVRRPIDSEIKQAGWP